MGVNTLLSTLIIAIAMSGGNSALDRKGKTSTESKKGGSSSSSSSKSSHVQQTTSSKGSGKNSSNVAKDSTKEKGKDAAPVPPVDMSKAGLQAVEVDMITSLEKDSLQAGLKKNRVWFQNYLADDLTGANTTGGSEDKAKLMGRYLDPAIVVESRTYDALNVRPYGEDVIIATGKVSEKGTSNNAPYDVQRTFIHVWVNRLGQWQQVAIQESPIQPGAVSSESAAAPPASADAKP